MTFPIAAIIAMQITIQSTQRMQRQREEDAARLRSRVTLPEPKGRTGSSDNSSESK